MTDSKLTILDNEFATIWCYPKKRILHHQLHRYFFGDMFRDILTKGLEAFEYHNCTKWLSDDRQYSAILPEDKAWGDKFWQPRMLAAGWRSWAMVLPEKVTGQMNIKKMVKQYETLGVATSYFTDPEAAIAWLESQR